MKNIDELQNLPIMKNHRAASLQENTAKEIDKIIEDADQKLS